MNVIIILLILQSGLRNVAVGSDTYNFYLQFEKVAYTYSWDDIFNDLYKTYILNEGKDAGYLVVEKLFGTFIPSFTMFLIFVAILFFVPFCRLAEKYLNTIGQMLLFFCIYQTIFYNFFSITGIRQTIATSLTIISIKFIDKKSIFKFTVCILIASMIHKSALLFLPLYFISKIKVNKYYLLFCVLAIPICIMYARPIATFLAFVSSTERYMYYAISDYETKGAVRFTVFLAFCAIITFLSVIRKVVELPNLLVLLIGLGLVFAPLTWVDPSLMRVGQYFSLYSIILTPIAITYFDDDIKIQGLLYFLIMLLLLITIIVHNVNYAFFWQEMQLGENYK